MDLLAMRAGTAQAQRPRNTPWARLERFPSLKDGESCLKS
jgi:hypothetical protein